MTRASDVELRITAIIVEQFGVSEDEVDLDTSLPGDLEADSLDCVELIIAVEEDFGLDIPDSDSAGLKTVGDIVAYVQRRLDRFAH